MTNRSILILFDVHLRRSAGCQKNMVADAVPIDKSSIYEGIFSLLDALPDVMLLMKNGTSDRILKSDVG